MGNPRAIDPKAVGARIPMRLPSLTLRGGKVAAAILDRRDIEQATPLIEIARVSGVSDAMVLKVGKKLGFAGFREFRQGLVDYTRSDTAALHQEISATDTAGEIVQKVFRTAMQALEETFAILDLDAFDRAVGYLFRARQRDFYGLGGSAQIARDVSHKFLRIGIRTSVFDDAHMMVMSAAMLGENAAARIAQPNLLDAIFVAVAQRDRKAADLNPSCTMRAVQSKRRR